MPTKDFVVSNSIHRRLGSYRKEGDLKKKKKKFKCLFGKAAMS